MFENAINGLQQFAINRAADAAVAELHDVVAGAHHQIVINPDLSEFIHQDGCLEAVLVVEDVIEQRGFSSSEKACEDGYWHGAGLLSCACHSGVSALHSIVAAVS